MKINKTSLVIHLEKSTTVPLTISVNDAEYYFNKIDKFVVLEYIPNYECLNTIKISTVDNNIKVYPIIITRIDFEDFWSLSLNKILMLPETNDPTVDKTSTHNCLFFVGSLIYNFEHAIFKNFIKGFW